ncbi:hypothetical protein PMI42_01156 [Bradyrhizobium sp. YR681]|nr:hypothetical protein PMI42_01156 [Bradyrhizobium sp. YR681]
MTRAPGPRYYFVAAPLWDGALPMRHSSAMRLELFVIAL